MGHRAIQRDMQEGAVEQVEKALQAESASEKDFHLRQALQLLDVTESDA